MKPVIALVGQQNVGKSTLFNRLTKNRNALVADYHGVTRDRIYGTAKINSCDFILIDSGGLTKQEDNISNQIRQQAHLAIDEADFILFLVDGIMGVSPLDEILAQQLLNIGKPVLLVINKTEGKKSVVSVSEYYSLCLGEPQFISATQGRGIVDLIDVLKIKHPSIVSATHHTDVGDSDELIQDNHIVLAVLGRPNVGKSTLINQILGEKRVIALDEPGTTRDSIYIPFKKDGSHYILIDTVGIRRRSRVSGMLEKFSIVKALQSLHNANVVILMLDTCEGIVEQDLRLAGLIIDSGRALVIVSNKCDKVKSSDRSWVSYNIKRRLPFLTFANIHFISALHGRGINSLFKSVQQSYASAMSDISTSKLTQILEDAVAEHQPPLVHGCRIKFRYTHLGGKNPPRIIIHGNQTYLTPNNYRRYLENTFRKALNLRGTPIKIEFKQGDNPFMVRKN
ncbi:MAG: ribosome biogenesis GTPase Der [Piscirickettsiaceae bacterium]|nr:ribosome biogenesis GTPase Der [Piscirickettsiaceae bacterium]